MSPLACSLLAFAALLAAADALMPGHDCQTLTIENPYELQVALRPILLYRDTAKDRIKVKKACRKKYGNGYHSAVQAVTACNYKKSGPTPSVTQVEYDNFSFDVDCNDCTGLLYVVENCFPRNAQLHSNASADDALCHTEKLAYPDNEKFNVDLRPIRFPPGGGEAKAIPNACRKKYGENYKGEILQARACTKRGFQAPSNIYQVDDWTLYIVCVDYGCNHGGYVQITVNCQKLDGP